MVCCHQHPPAGVVVAGSTRKEEPFRAVVETPADTSGGGDRSCARCPACDDEANLYRCHDDDQRMLMTLRVKYRGAL